MYPAAACHKLLQFVVIHPTSTYERHEVRKGIEPDCIKMHGAMGKKQLKEMQI
jgi:hypothetical protein